MVVSVTLIFIKKYHKFSHRRFCCVATYTALISRLTCVAYIRTYIRMYIFTYTYIDAYSFMLGITIIYILLYVYLDRNYTDYAGNYA